MPGMNPIPEIPERKKAWMASLHAYGEAFH
jgi:hypothetical protein